MRWECEFHCEKAIRIPNTLSPIPIPIFHSEQHSCSHGSHWTHGNPLIPIPV